jgi:hypothetical protein
MLDKYPNPARSDDWGNRKETYYFPRFEFGCRWLLWFFGNLAIFELLELAGKILVIASIVKIAFYGLE